MRRRFFASDGLNPHFDFNNYLTIEALEDGLQVRFTKAIEYSINGQSWELLMPSSSTKIINKGEFVSFRAKLNQIVLTPNTFTINKACNLKGNAMSMIFGDDAENNNSLSGQYGTFYGMFLNCITIKSVSKNFLPATTLIDDCYRNMFQGCTGLTQAPELPATTLASSCYYSMFNGCTSLVNAPELPATTLVDVCYEFMFNNCINLNYIKMLATNISATFSLYDWVRGVSPTGTFVKSKDATWNVVGDSGVPEGWVVLTDEFGDLIEFTVDGTVYQAQEGMTWTDFVGSPFNPSTGTHFVLYRGIVMVLYNYVGEMTTPPQTLVQLNGINMLPSDLIISGGSYTTKSDGGSGN